MPDLTALRAELDGIDDALHDLLMRRAAVVEQVGARKAGARWRPGREAAILRRLIARHSGHYPEAALMQVWRELLAGSLAMQGPFTVAVADGASAAARCQFGLLTTLVRAERPLAAVREKSASVAIMPVWGDWWNTLDGLHIVARLPWRGPAAMAPAYAVAASPPDPSGDDHTLLALHGAADWDAAGLRPHALTIGSAGCALADVLGWIEPDDPRLAALGGSAQVVGAYATPLPW